MLIELEINELNNTKKIASKSEIDEVVKRIFFIISDMQQVILSSSSIFIHRKKRSINNRGNQSFDKFSKLS